MDINKINDPAEADPIDEISDGSTDDERNPQSWGLVVRFKFPVKKNHNSYSNKREENKKCFYIKAVNVRKDPKGSTGVFDMGDMEEVWNYLDRLIKGDIMFYPRLGYLI